MKQLKPFVKTGLSLLLAVVFVLGATGCSGGKEVDHAAVANTLYDTVELDQDELVEVQPAIIENYYPGLSELSEDYTIYVNGPGGKVEEIAVITAKEGAKVSDIKTIIDNRIERQKTLFVDYVPAEMPKLDNAVIKTEGNSIILVISGDDNAEKAVKDALK